MQTNKPGCNATKEIGFVNSRTKRYCNRGNPVTTETDVWHGHKPGFVVTTQTPGCDRHKTKGIMH
jgi:hypothetical protein